MRQTCAVRADDEIADGIDSRMLYCIEIINACIRINDFRADMTLWFRPFRLPVEPVQQSSQSKNDISSAGLCSECQLARTSDGRGRDDNGGPCGSFISNDERMQLDKRGVCISLARLGKWLGKRGSARRA